MTRPPVLHGTLTFERRFKVPPSTVFGAYVDIERRARWSAPSDSAVVTYTEHDFRVGGLDRFCCGDKRAPQFEGEVRYEDIAVDERIIYSEVIKANDQRLSISLVTWETSPDGTGSRLTVTVQIASLVGDEMIAGNTMGMNGALDNLARMLEE
jgi:uncharacterized protein YndB with AHSA1/START domain